MIPRFSVVIPTHRRPASLTRCLRALTAMDFPSDRFEVITVLDGESGPAPESARPLATGPEVRWIAQPHRGPAAARNNGAAHARFEHLVFTDDDCLPRADWLKTLASHLRESPGAVVGGRTLNTLADNVCSAASQLVVDHLIERGASFLASNNLAMRRETFDSIGGFDPSFALAGGEDRDFCRRCAERGIPLVQAPEAIVDHEHALSLRAFLRQHGRYGRGARRYRCAGAADSGRIRFESAGFYLGLLASPWTRGSTTRRAGVSLMLAASQAATAAGYFAEWLRPRPDPVSEPELSVSQA